MAIGNDHRVIAFEGFLKIDDTLTIRRPRRRIGSLGKERTWCAASHRQEQKWFSVGRVEPNLGPIAREPEFADDDAAADERRHTARQVGELASAYLTQPDIELAVVIREKGDELSRVPRCSGGA